MLKTLSLAVALLIGVVSAKKSLMAYENTNTYDADFVTGSYGVNMDINYHTEYRGGPYSDGDAVPNDKSYGFKQYSLTVETTVDLLLDTKWFDFYQANYDVQLVPARVTPYSQYVIWYRPIADKFSFDNWDMNFYACWKAEVLQLVTSVTEWAKTAEVSVYDYIEDSENNHLELQDSDYTFDPDYESEYDDKYWSVDLASKILSADLLQKLNKENDIYNWWVLGKYDW